MSEITYFHTPSYTSNYKNPHPYTKTRGLKKLSISGGASPSPVQAIIASIPPAQSLAVIICESQALSLSYTRVEH